MAEKAFLGALSLGEFLLSVPILVGGIVLLATSGCDKSFHWPVVAVGAFLVLVSLTASCFLCSLFAVKHRLFLAASLLFFFAIIAFIVFACVITYNSAGRFIPGRGYEEYQLGDYSKWLQKRVEKSSNWNKIKRCIQNSNVCNKLAVDSADEVAKEFYKKNLSSIQSGCCKPPSSCNFAYVNATYWISTAGNFRDMDCSRWNNEQDQLCYNCDSCKAGVLATANEDWRKAAFISILVFFGITVLTLGLHCAVSVLCDSSPQRRGSEADIC